MPTIENPGHPLVFRVPTNVAQTPQSENSNLNMRTYVRAFGGMQKEAVVALSTGESWRLVSDEGPYLNGTDLAPFPLGHFQVGMQFSLMAEILKHAKATEITLKSLEFAQVNGYSMEGSALRGTMTGGAIPVEVKISVEADADPAEIGQLIRKAEQTSPAHALMRDLLENTFALRYNNQVLDLPELTPSPIPSPDSSDLASMYEQVQPDSAESYLADIITKREAAEVIHGVEGGASSSLQESQKRQLHVSGSARWIEGTLMEATTQVVKPIGSLFRFVCDAEGGNTPPPLAYLSAGVGFCYMTQLGRYAHIKKYDLASYQIIQDNWYSEGEGDSIGSSSIFDTHVYLEAGESDAEAQKTVTMGEQTCFLHAAMRDVFPTQLSATLNGEAVEVPG